MAQHDEPALDGVSNRTVAEPSMSVPSVSIVGMHGGSWFGERAASAVHGADVVIGAQRLLDALPADVVGERIALAGPLDEMIDLIDDHHQAGRRVCQLASGDPGFFGIGRLLVGRFGDNVDIHPAPSSVALAFARAGVAWDDAIVVSAHGRRLDNAIAALVEARKAAVLVSPTNPPEAVGRALIDAGASDRRVIVCSHLGEPTEAVTVTELDELASGCFDPLSVVVLLAGDSAPARDATVRWGRPIDTFAHRDGMITKPEVRAIALSKLDLFGAGTLWDVGAASGSVGIEAATIAPGLRVVAIERDADECDRIRHNAGRIALTVVHDAAPAAFDGLTTPDRIFVGGGGREVFDAAASRLAEHGKIVATFAVMSSALAALERLGHDGEMVQVAVSRAVPVGAHGLRRLHADNPVFVVWGSPS